MTLPRISLQFEDASEPLGKRVPAHDEHGRALGDFMMLIPGLRDEPQHCIERTLHDLQLALARHAKLVVFAEFNLKLNLLWVSTRPVNGIRLEIAASIRELVPQAKLISHI